MEQFVLIQKAEEKKHTSPIILVHGSWGSSLMWMNYVQFLSKKGWDVYAPDLRGHGKSKGSVAGSTMGDYVADVIRAITENKLENPIVIGHSMGGLVGLMYAAFHGAQAVVAIDPSPTKEVRGGGEKKEYPAEYSPMDAGMPSDPMEIMRVFPDISQETLMQLKNMLGMESQYRKKSCPCRHYLLEEN